MSEGLRNGQDVSARPQNQSASSPGLGREKNGGQLQFPWRVGWGEFTQTDMEVLFENRAVRPIERRIPDSRSITLPMLVTRFIPGLDTLRPVGED